MKDAVLSVVRHVLTVGGTYLASVGIVDGGSIETTVGAVVTLIAFAWGIWDKRTRVEAPKA